MLRPACGSMGALAVRRRPSPGGCARTPEARKAIIEQLSLQMVVADEAVKKGLDKTPEVTDRLEAIRMSVLADTYVQDRIESNPVSDDAMKAEYERIKATVTGTECKARHILVARGSGNQGHHQPAQEGARCLCQARHREVEGPGLRSQGRRPRVVRPRGMGPEFAAALGKMEKGKFSDEPVRSQLGYPVILLEDTRPVEPPPDAVKAQLAQQRQHQSVQKHLDALKAAAEVEVVGAAASAPAAAASPAAK